MGPIRGGRAVGVEPWELNLGQVSGAGGWGAEDGRKWMGWTKRAEFASQTAGPIGLIRGGGRSDRADPRREGADRGGLIPGGRGRSEMADQIGPSGRGRSERAEPKGVDLRESPSGGGQFKRTGLEGGRSAWAEPRGQRWEGRSKGAGPGEPIRGGQSECTELRGIDWCFDVGCGQLLCRLRSWLRCWVGRVLGCVIPSMSEQGKQRNTQSGMHTRRQTSKKTIKQPIWQASQRTFKELINRSINQSINQSFIQSINQLVI